MAVVHVITHTHWDREWYHPAARFRQYLVRLVDELLDALPTEDATFLLDGQTVVLDDFLEVRPERSADLTALLQQGRIEAGPWFVLADELIPSGEALIRNLLAGRHRARAMGFEPPPVLYCPDSFGHPAAMPTLAEGFGLNVLVALRGYGGERWPAGDLAWWESPSGARVLFYHFSKHGYEGGAQLPDDAEAARARWTEIADDLLPRTRAGHVLLMNGADHHARQSGLATAFVRLAESARPHEVRRSSLGAFARAVAAAAPDSLPVVRGEFRDSYGYVWTLPGTLATRAHQKRRNAIAERLLTREVEPMAALECFRADRGNAGARSQRQAELRAAWRSVLLSHPHDTLCGCSIDEVARAMDQRLDEAVAQGTGLRDDLTVSLIGHDRDTARTRRDAWKPIALIRNHAPRRRGGVALLRLTSFVADVKVGMHADPTPPRSTQPRTPALPGAAHVQVLARTRATELTEAPRHYPDADIVEVTEVAAWVPPVAPSGIRALKQTNRATRGEIPNPVRASATPDRTCELSNGHVTLRVDASGRASLVDDAGARAIPSLTTWESRADVGDEYTPSIRTARFTAKCRKVRVVHRGPVRGTIATHWELRDATERITCEVRYSLDADARFVRIAVHGTNGATNHRLRLGIATGVTARAADVFADAAFGPVKRTPLHVSADDARVEFPLPTAPLHRYVSRFALDGGATVYSDGLCEYEATDDGTIWITLVRSVGELSRNDLPERPGHAGWPAHTPGAQCIGAFNGEFALLLHGTRTSTTLDEIECTADDVLLPLTGGTLRSALTLPDEVTGVELIGTGLALAAMKPLEDGSGVALRCVNVTDDPQRGTWVLPFVCSAAMVARLDETPIAPATVDGTRISFDAAPRAPVTILVRR